MLHSPNIVQGEHRGPDVLKINSTWLISSKKFNVIQKMLVITRPYIQRIKFNHLQMKYHL